MKRFFQFLGLIILGYLSYAFVTPSADYSPQGFTFSDSFDSYYAKKLKNSKDKKARPQNEELLIRFAKKTEMAFLYVHGFGASRGEGQYVMKKLANNFRANTYMLRLPGHGTNPEAHRDSSYKQYIAEVEEVIFRMQQLGNRVYIVASSMGAAISTYLSTYYGDKIAGLILFSPFFDYAEASAKALSWPGGHHLVEMVLGKYRNIESKNNPEPKTIKGWQRFWYVNQYTRSLVSLEHVRQVINQSNIIDQVHVPVLMFYYYKDEKNYDRAASVSAMKQAFARFHKNELNKMVQVKDGDHVLSSAYIKTDKKLILSEIQSFVKKVSARKLTAQNLNKSAYYGRSN